MQATDPGSARMRSPEVRIAPGRGLVDEPLHVAIHGGEPGVKVTIRARVAANGRLLGESSAQFEIPDGGVLDLARTAPLSGDYEGVTTTGLLQGMGACPPDRRLLGDDGGSSVDDARPSRSSGGPAPLRVEFACLVDGEPLGAATAERLFMADGVRRLEVRDDGLVGTFFAPSRAPGAPVLVLGGSEGGIPESVAALLASRGHPALALAYLGGRPLKRKPVRVPVEYVLDGLGWLAARPESGSSRPVIVGSSLGAQLGLLAASVSPAVGGVVSFSGSGVVVPVANRLWPASPFRSGGRDVPFLRHAGSLALLFRFFAASLAPRSVPISLTRYRRNALANRERVARATIAIEKAACPVIMFSGDDDQIWPSSPLCSVLEERLAGAAHRFGHELHVYEGAGHTLGIPYLPFSDEVALGPFRFLTGGKKLAHQRACVDSWDRMLGFLTRCGDEACQGARA